MRFRLGKLLRIKELKENDLKNRRAMLKYSLEEERRRLLEKEVELEQCREEFLSLNRSKCLTPSELCLHSSYRDRLLREREAQINAVHDVEARLNDLTAALMRLYKEKKVLENLRQKQWRRFLEELDRMQQKLIDEFSIRNSTTRTQ